MHKPLRVAVPDDFPVLGTIFVDRLLERRKRVKDPLLHLCETWNQDTYASTTWTKEAYTKIFEKFSYGDAQPLEKNFPDEFNFAKNFLLDEYGYMQSAVILQPCQTDKQVDSTPAFPKFLYFDTEADYLAECGWQEYNNVWHNFSDETATKRPLWWTFLKNETLKKTKIQDNDIRMIMCTDPVFTRFGACFDQHQNALMKERTETHQAQVGWTPFYQGFDRRLRRLERGGRVIIETDWTRFDGTIPVEVFRLVKKIRWFLHSERYKTPEMKRRYDWYVENLIDKVVLLPTGEVTRISKGNPSGQISTTTDNNFVNTFLTAFEVAHFYKCKTGRVPTIPEYRANVDSICYGDDRLLAVNPAFLDYMEVDLPTFYREVFGMWVKKENVKIFPDAEGASFCGLTAVKTEQGYVGIPNVDKILSTLEFPVKSLPSIEALWGKLVSLRILCQYASKEARDFLELNIQRVRFHAEAEGIELPEVPELFYKTIWTGGPKNLDGAETSA